MNTGKATDALRSAGVTVNEVGAETTYSQRMMSKGSTAAATYVSAMLNGRDRLAPECERAIRALVPGKVADQVVRLAAEAREARRG